MLPLITSAVTGIGAGILGHQKDVSNAREHGKRLELYKNLLKGAAFTGKYPDENLIENKPDNTGMLSGLIGGTKLGYEAGDVINNWNGFNKASKNILSKKTANDLSIV